MVIGGKESSWKAKAGKWKISWKRWIEGIGVGMQSNWYRVITEVPKQRRGGEGENALCLTKQQYAMGWFLSDELSLSKCIGSLEWKKQMAHGRWSVIICLSAWFLYPSHRIWWVGEEKSPDVILLIPTCFSLSSEISWDSNFPHKLLVKKVSIIAKDFERLAWGRVFCGEKRLVHRNAEIRDIKNKDSKQFSCTEAWTKRWKEAFQFVCFKGSC